MVLNDAIGDFFHDEFQIFEPSLSLAEIEMISAIIYEVG
jgi:hypothetical protein